MYNLFIRYGTKFYQDGLSIPSEYLQKLKNTVVDEKTDELIRSIKDNIEITNNGNERVYKQDIFELFRDYHEDAIKK